MTQTAKHYPEPCCQCGQLPAGRSSAINREPFMPEARETIEATITKHKAALKDVSLYLHANPELAWKEFKAHERLTSFLTEQGYKVEAVADIPTAFRVSYERGEGGRVFGLNSEFDALPGIGHACGHNLIAITGVGAFLAIREAMDAQNINGKVVLLGTPAEEGEGGKIKLLEAGLYDELGACMMLHPGPAPPGTPATLATGGSVGCYALQSMEVTFTGKPAHAGLAPWEGVNALDAATVAYAGISAMRQQFKPAVRVHGVITDGGGPVPNIIPPKSQLRYLIRAPSTSDLEIVRRKVSACFEGAALQTGCKVSIECSHVHNECRNETNLATEFATAMKEMYDGQFVVDPKTVIGASTDFGNVTFTLPAAHPMYGIPAPPGASNHTHGFTAATKTDEAHELSFKCTGGMAAVGVRYLADAEFAAEVRKSWEKSMAELKAENAAAMKAAGY